MSADAHKICGHPFDVVGCSDCEIFELRAALALAKEALELAANEFGVDCDCQTCTLHDSMLKRTLSAIAALEGR